MKNDADPRAHPWQKDAIKYANGHGERDAEISCARIRPSTLSTTQISTGTARPIGERVVHKLSILRPLSFRSLCAGSFCVHTPFLAKRSASSWKWGKKSGFFLSSLYLPSFLPSCLLAGFYPWDRRHPGLSGSSLVSQTLQAESTKKRRGKKSWENSQRQIFKWACRRPWVAYFFGTRYRCCSCCFFLLIISASLQPFMLGSFVF